MKLNIDKENFWKDLSDKKLLKTRLINAEFCPNISDGDIEFVKAKLKIEKSEKIFFHYNLNKDFQNSKKFENKPFGLIQEIIVFTDYGIRYLCFDTQNGIDLRWNIKWEMFVESEFQLTPNQILLIHQKTNERQPYKYYSEYFNVKDFRALLYYFLEKSGIDKMSEEYNNGKQNKGVL